MQGLSTTAQGFQIHIELQEISGGNLNIVVIEWMKYSAAIV